VAVDAVRPEVQERRRIDPWYRYNTLLYVQENRLGELPAVLQDRILSADQPIPELCPITIRLRNRVVSLLPLSWATGLAKQKEKFILRRVIRKQKRSQETYEPR
jgi:hypothetical protein